MEARKFNQPRDTACSFETVLHPEYESIKAECDPWLLSVTQPTSLAAAQFWVDSLFPFLTCLAYPHCPADRVANLTKFITWVFVADDEDDHPALLGCNSIDSPAMRRRHKLILACLTDDPLATGEYYNGNHNSRSTDVIRSEKLLRDAWGAMCKDMSTRLQARLYDGMRDYLNAVALQAHYRGNGIIPAVDEYISVRQATSLVGFCFILLEYALGIELDEETLQDERIQQLYDAGVDHVSFTNDIMSCHVELFRGDQFNLPAIIYWNNINNIMEGKEAGFYTFQDAMQGAMRMLDEVDERSARLMEELRESELIKKEGIEAYVKGIGAWIAGNRTWSLKTARYTHNCPPEQDLVLAVEQQELKQI